MEKININRIGNYIHYVCILALVCMPLQVSAKCACGCERINEDDADIDYEKLGEYEEIFRDFENQIEVDEQSEAYKAFFLVKWCKKLKRWFKKRVYNFLSSISGLKGERHPEYCAYTVAHFKRKVDKICYTMNIDELFRMCSKEIGDSPAFASMQKFNARIRYYHDNKDALPPRHPQHNRYDQSVKDCDLEDVPTRAIFGGVEVACGCLIVVLPFPGCSWLGKTLIAHGSYQIYEGYMRQYEQQNKDCLVN